MKNVLASMLVITVLIVLSVTMANAGGGQGGGGANFAAFQCYSIDGVNQHRTVTLDDQFGTREKIHVGKGKLLCTPVRGALEEGELDALDPLLAFDHLKCYDMSQNRALNPTPVVKVTDQFDIENVEVFAPSLLCMVMNKNDQPR
jgi:hypothetical protein